MQWVIVSHLSWPGTEINSGARQIGLVQGDVFIKCMLSFICLFCKGCGVISFSSFSQKKLQALH